AGHQIILVCLTALLQYGKEPLCQGGNLHNSRTGIQLEIQQHLVIAGTTTVDLLAYITQSSCKHQLNLRVDVFYPFFNPDTLSTCYPVQLPQLSKEQIQFLTLEKTYRLQHYNMGHTTKDIKLCQFGIQFSVTTYREVLYLLVNRLSLVPKFHFKFS